MKESFLKHWKKIVAALAFIAMLVGSFFLGRYTIPDLPIAKEAKEIVIVKPTPLPTQPFITIRPAPTPPPPKTITLYKEKPHVTTKTNPSSGQEPSSSPRSSIRLELPNVQVAPPSLVYEVEGEEKLRVAPTVKTDRLSGQLYVGIEATSPLGPGKLALSATQGVFVQDKRLVAEFSLKF